MAAVVGSFYCGKMAQEFAKVFYRSIAWKRCRESYIQSRIMIDGGMCEECGSRLGYIVHHTVTLTPDNINNPDVSLNHELLKYVCKECHDEYEGHGVSKSSKIKSLCVFDENGQPISQREIDISPHKNDG